MSEVKAEVKIDEFVIKDHEALYVKACNYIDEVESIPLDKRTERDVTGRELAYFVREEIDYLLAQWRKAQRTGHWMSTAIVPSKLPPRAYTCSLCRCYSEAALKYCPNCGARMEDDEHEGNN